MSEGELNRMVAARFLGESSRSISSAKTDNQPAWSSS